MPLAMVRYNKRKVSEPDMFEVVRWLPHWIAPALHVESVPDAHLTPGDIEVWANESSPLDVMGPYDLCVFIFANEYPERVPMLKDAVASIRDKMREKLQALGYHGPNKLRVWVWPFLGPADFVDFTT